MLPGSLTTYAHPSFTLYAYPQLGDTPLHWACARDHPDVVLLLLGKGANANTRNLVGPASVGSGQGAHNASTRNLVGPAPVGSGHGCTTQTHATWWVLAGCAGSRGSV